MSSFFGGGIGGGFPGFGGDFFNDPFLTDIDMMPGVDMSGTPWAGGDWGAWGRGGEPRAGPRQRPGRRQRREEAASQRSIRVNMVQEEEKYCVCFEVPGRTKDDLCVSLEANVLKVCGKALEPEEEEEAEHRPAQPSERVPIAGATEKAAPHPAESKASELSGGGEKTAERQGAGGQAKAGEGGATGGGQPSGTSAQQHKPQRRYLMKEIPTGQIERSVRLPGDAQEVLHTPTVEEEEGICAKCQNGILTVCVPRLPRKRPVQIQ